MKFGYFHVERQPLRQQHQDTERLCRRHNRRGGLRRGSGSAFGLDRRASLQHLGLLSCPDLVLANVAARTRQIRLAPAVTVLPLHHPIRVAEQWATLDLLSAGRVDFAAGRGYDRREYLPLNVSFEDNQKSSRRGWRSFSACGRATHRSPTTARTTGSKISRSRHSRCSVRRDG